MPKPCCPLTVAGEGGKVGVRGGVGRPGLSREKERRMNRTSSNQMSTWRWGFHYGLPVIAERRSPQRQVLL